jgi:predicted transport protein
MYKSTKIIEDHFDGAMPELISTFQKINKRILAISKEVGDPYATKANICYRTTESDVRFIELRLQKRRNILRFFLRTKSEKLKDPKHLIKEAVPESHKWGSGVIIWLDPMDLQKGEYNLDDILDLITQSFDACR